MARPTTIFCHGAYLCPEIFNKVIAILEPLGYKCVAIKMPGTGRIPPVSSLNEDIAAVRMAVMTELNAGYNVLVQAHSWAGRRKDGGVVKLAFVSAFVLPEGISLEGYIGGIPSRWIVSEDGTVMLGNFMTAMFHDIPREEAEKWVARLRPQSLATLKDNTRSATWKTIPSAYLVCEDDQAIGVQGQDAMIAKVKEAGGIIDVERVFSSYSPYLSKPEYVADFLRRAAGEKF